MTDRKNAPLSKKSADRLKRYHNRKDHEEKIGRKLKPDEEAHHVSKNKTVTMQKKAHGKLTGRGNKGPKGVY